MPGIWNVNNVYNNSNTRKFSSKLTFSVGEKFSGRIVSKGDGKDVTIRLSDGWQFIAELDGNINLDDLKLLNFQVEDFKDGKLKLKLIPNEQKGEEVSNEVFKEVMDKEGLSKEDINILEKMIKHNISLTKDNINKIKGLIQFNENINLSSDNIDDFIQNYLQSKGIDINTPKGELIKQNLVEFFSNFKNMSSDEILLFLENNIEFSTENIKSFNELFNGDLSIEKLLYKLSQELDNSQSNLKDIQNKEIITDKEYLNKENINNEFLKNNNKNSLISKIYDSNDVSKNKVSVVSLLKSITGDKERILNDYLNDIINSRAENLTTKEFNRLISLTSKFEDSDIVNLIKNQLSTKGLSDETIKSNGLDSKVIDGKNLLENTLGKILNKEVNLTNEEFKRFNDLIKYKLQTNINEQDVKPEAIKIDKSQNSQLKSDINNLYSKDIENFSNKDLIKQEMVNKFNEVKNIVKDIINNIDNKAVGYEKVMEMIKGNIGEFKIFNSISEQYYYLNFQVPVNAEEYPCKLIIKDNRKGGKKIDKTNVKMVVNVKTIHLGDVDGYLTLKDNRIDINLKCDNKYVDIISKNKNKLKSGLETLGLVTEVSVSLREEPINLVTCGKFFNDLSISNIDIKV
ncbi:MULTISPECIES: flagellar hook-length control protein FliK [unclassified Clostridium]|uniref:flagellar hook-length control protein FliK n=1 Tax=unclassified Clostridium TaxID=2614128 RepID=UPI0013FBDB03|nr:MULTISPECIES: flagellar hook-length control protein FliK [unclassified Clostridium]NFR86613.1 flagellar hook-length control protein FliK [Clostridium botulinum]NFR90436.1 flagellar hook-length control protein FliK [Clostridium botulinum]NFT98907.1 flagellar hook-length control protein FliK [Clostridium botulinum]